MSRRYTAADVAVGDRVTCDSRLREGLVTGMVTEVLPGGVCLDGDFYAAWDLVVAVDRTLPIAFDAKADGL